MFLTPQHFQAQDEYFEQHIQFRATASSSCNWGLTGLAIDQEALSNGIFTIRHCRGILPDGLTFNIPEADEPPQGREIAEYFPPTEPELDVFLALAGSAPARQKRHRRQRPGRTHRRRHALRGRNAHGARRNRRPWNRSRCRWPTRISAWCSEANRWTAPLPSASLRSRAVPPEPTSCARISCRRRCRSTRAIICC